jgi:hypothetical protein
MVGEAVVVLLVQHQVIKMVVQAVQVVVQMEI